MLHSISKQFYSWVCQNVYQLFSTLSHQGDYLNAASEYKQVSVKLVLSSSSIA